MVYFPGNRNIPSMIFVVDFFPLFSRVPSGKAPHFLQKPTIKQQANLLVMTCILEAKPGPQIKWFRETQELKDGGRYIIKLENDAKTPDGFIATLQIKVGVKK